MSFILLAELLIETYYFPLFPMLYFLYQTIEVEQNYIYSLIKWNNIFLKKLFYNFLLCDGTSGKFNFIQLNDSNKHTAEMSNLDFQPYCYWSYPRCQG